MNLYNSIFQRKSCRKYNMEPLSTQMLKEIENAINAFIPLYPNLAISWRFSNKVKGSFHVDAPHYIIISGHGKPGESESVGFLFEQLVLMLDSKNIGCVWLGASKDVLNPTDNDIIAIGFGNTSEQVHRNENEFKRKPIEKITNNINDICMKTVHLAPSGLNTQPWYFQFNNDKVLVYKQILKPPISLIYKHSDIDMGIALCHYALTCQSIGKIFNFERTTNLPKKRGYVSFGIITE